MEKVAGAALADGIELVVARLDLAPRAVRRLSAWLSHAERQRAARFHRECDRRRFTVSRARLRELLARRFGKHPREIELAYGTNGKPVLARGSLRFNLSHCDDLALYAFGEGREIGVDVEALRELPEADDIATRFFSAPETAAYRSLPAAERTLGFFHCWTRKEAFVKALGHGLAVPLNRFAVSLAPREPAQVLEIDGVRGAGGWRLASFSPQAGFIAALAVAPR